jgi:glucan-binding YG repeat protein
MWDNSAKWGPVYIPVEGEDKSTNAFNTAKNFWWFNEDGTVGGQSGWKSFVTIGYNEKGEETPYRAWFYVNSDGTVAKGWKDEAGNWYELGNDFGFNYGNSSVELVTGRTDGNNIQMSPNLWVDEENGKFSDEDWYNMPRYWVNPDGTFVVSNWASRMGTTMRDGKEVPHRYWYFADENGELVQGWNNIDGTWYYFGTLNPEDEKPYGYNMQENRDLNMDGVTYRVDKLGALVTGWSENADGNWNYFDPATGAEVKDQWKQIDGKWYYFEGADAITYGFFDYDGDQYYAGKDGVMATGWVADNPGEWYKFGDDGVQQTGWVEDGGNWYYLDPDNNGQLVVNDWVDGEYVGSDGAWIAETPAG